jgi:hypothetical protein
MARPPEVKARKAPGVKRSSPDKVRTEVREAPGPEVVQMRIEVVAGMKPDKAIKVKTTMTTKKKKMMMMVMMKMTMAMKMRMRMQSKATSEIARVETFVGS